MSTKDGKHEPNLIYEGAGFWPTYISSRCPYDDGFDGCQLKKRREPCVCERHREASSVTNG